MDIFIHKDGENLGPFTLEQAKEKLDCNDFTSTDHAWHENLAGWMPLGDLLSATSPSPQSDTSALQASVSDSRRERATIYIVRGDIELGPYTVDEINTHLKTGVFKTSDVAKHSGLETLSPLIAVPGVGSWPVSPLPRPEPKPHAAYRSNTVLVVALLAVAGVIGLIAFLTIRSNDSASAQLTISGSTSANKRGDTTGERSGSTAVTPSRVAENKLLAAPAEAGPSPAVNPPEMTEPDSESTAGSFATRNTGALVAVVQSISEEYGIDKDHQDGLPNVTCNAKNIWHVVVGIRDIRGDLKQANTLGLIALLIARDVSARVNKETVKCDLVVKKANAHPEILVSTDSLSFENQAYIIHADEFPQIGQHGWIVASRKHDNATPKQGHR